jgi:hypothetical protein
VRRQPLGGCCKVNHRSGLQQLTVSRGRVVFISVTGPPLEEWDPLPYVRSWLAQGRHAATDLGKARTNKSEIAEGLKAIWKCL